MWKKRLVTLALVAGFAAEADAQFSTFRAAALAPNSGRTPTAIAIGDFDENGRLDAATSNSSNGTVTIFLSFGGQLYPDGHIAVGGVPQAVLVGKFNADNHLDLVVANGSSSMVCLAGDGAGNFALPGRDTEVGPNPSALVTADFNADGRADVAVANEGESETANGSVSVVLGNGDCTFTTVATLNAGLRTWALAAGDVNGDGRDDIVAVNGRSNSISVFLNNGSGTGFSSAGTFATGPEPTGVALARLNGDAALDAVVAERNSDAVSVFLGNGAGAFTLDETYAVGSFPSAVGAGNLDSDPFVDLVVANDLSGDVSVLRGTGNGTFGRARHFVADGQPAALALADMDADGVTDVVTANVVGSDGSVAVLFNRGGAVLHGVEDMITGMGPTGLAIGDLNDDALPDMVVVHENGSVMVLAASAGTGFAVAQDLIIGGQPRRAALADLDRDGDLDLAVVDNAGNRVVVMTGNGDATFTGPRELSTGAGPTALAFGDYNGDGKADLAVAVFGPPGQVSIFLGRGDGTFHPSGLCNVTVGDAPVEIAARNIDALDAEPVDRKDDLVVVNEGSQTVSVLKSIDGCTFSSTILDGLSGPKAVAVGLFDGDLKPDVVVGNSVISVQHPGIRLFTGKGDGTFVRGFSASSKRVDAMAARDFTGDGITDLLVCDETSNLVQLLRGNGSGRFFVESEANVSRMPVFAAAADFNGDGLYDAASANAHVTANNVSVLTNCVGEAWCLDAPRPAPLRGDGNGDDTVSAADFVAVVKEVSDGDGRQVEDVTRAGFAAAAGVDANGDGRVDPQDAQAVAVRIFAQG